MTVSEGLGWRPCLVCDVVFFLDDLEWDVGFFLESDDIERDVGFFREEEDGWDTA